MAVQGNQKKCFSAPLPNCDYCTNLKTKFLHKKT
jgi:hypothetical protein